jgi:hypothetical protein
LRHSLKIWRSLITFDGLIITNPGAAAVLQIFR